MMFVQLARLGVIDEVTAHALRGAVGFRNVAVHAYQEIDYAVLFSICTKHLDDFRSFARQIMAALEVERPSPSRTTNSPPL
jgi:uncharacterized protein YutE (UPF0331/DUF86 family)